MVQDNLARALEELQRMQLEGLAGIANLVGAAIHEINTPLSALAGAADVNSRCALRMRAIVASVGSLEELRKNSQFERALDLIGENSQLIQAAAQSIGEQTGVLRDFVQSVPQPEAAPALSRIVDEVLEVLQRESDSGGIVRGPMAPATVLMREPVLEWMLLECVRHVLALRREGPVCISSEPADDQKVALILEYSGRDGRERDTELARWVKRGGAELRSESTGGSKVRLCLILPCEGSL
jgi:signal transduction histidine kinase